MSLATLHAGLAGRVRPLVRRLPMHPPAVALAAALNLWLLPRLTPEQRAGLSHRIVQIEVGDLGLSLRLRLDERGFLAVAGEAPAALRIVAAAPTYWRLLRGVDDADRLFFERQLVMEGDTELGVALKNTLDALEPPWR